MAELTRFRIAIDPQGTGTVEVGGRDVSNQVNGIDVQMRVGQPSVVTLHHVAGRGDIEGEGIVRVVSQAEAGPAQVAEWLTSVDPAALEAEVLNRAGFADSTFEVALAVLREWAHARP